MGKGILCGFGGGDGCKIRFTNYRPPAPGEGNHGSFEARATGGNYPAAAAAGTKAVFAGGRKASAESAGADAYDEDGTHSLWPDLSSARQMLAGASVAGKAWFAGGLGPGGGVETDCYDAAGVRSAASVLSAGRFGLAGAAAGEKAVFAGGLGYGVANHAEVDALAPDGARTAFPALSAARGHLAGAAVGAKALFGGGGNSVLTHDSSTSVNTGAVEAYDANGLKTTFPTLSAARRLLAAAPAGGRALFAGGENAAKASAAVDAYTALGARTAFPSLPDDGRSGLAAAPSEQKVVVGSGTGPKSASGWVSLIPQADAYDGNGLRTALPEGGISDGAAAPAGRRAVFSGGSAVEWYFTETPTTEIPVLGTGLYNFDGTEHAAPGDLCAVNQITVPRPVNGYIRYKGGTVT